MASFHFIMQGKGGVGKSMVASLLFQTLKEHFNKEVIGYDLDPANHTFAGYKELGVKIVEIFDITNKTRVSSGIDTFVDDLLSAECASDQHYIIDSGSSALNVWSAYLEEISLFHLLINKRDKDDNESSNRVFIHSILAGGQMLIDTTTNFDALCKMFPDVSFILWVNPFFGAVRLADKDYTEFTAYNAHKNKIVAEIKLPYYQSNLASADVEAMFAARRTFNTAINSGSATIPTQIRLTKFRDYIFKSIENAPVLFI